MEQSAFSRFTIDKIYTAYDKLGNLAFARYRRSRLTNTDFTIISNNCWGGSVYRRFGLPYNSPTVGLYFFADEYIRFLKDIDNNLKAPIKFISFQESRYKSALEQKGQTNIPIGLLNNDIEIVFLHYSSEEEAYTKWKRRALRYNPNNLIVKFSQMNNCTGRHIAEFESLEFPKKVLFLSAPVPNVHGTVISRYTHNGEITNDTIYYNRYINLERLINGK